MTPEERTAFIRQQAQERLQARMKALGMATASDDSGSKVDQSVEDRLAREKKEAEEKTKLAEKQQEEREASRKARLQQAGVVEPREEVKATPPSPAAVPKKSAMKKAPAPPAPKPRATPSSTNVAKAGPPQPPISRAQSNVTPAAAPAKPKESAEEAELRAQEEAHKKAMEERRARLKRMQEEEEEATRAEESLAAKRRESASAAKKAEAPVASPPAVVSPPPANVSTNPFRKLQNNAAAASPAQPIAGGGFNPFVKPPTASPAPEARAATPPPPSAPAPAPPPAASSAFSAPKPVAMPAPPKRPAYAPSDEDWDVIDEKQNDSDSSDEDDYAGSRKQREQIAASLFGGAGARTPSKPASPAPVANKAALAKLGGGDPSDRGGLLSAIQAGRGLRKAVTVDRSAASVSGKVIGGDEPPAHINATPRSPSPPTPKESAPPMSFPSPSNASTSNNDSRAINRQSVDWYQGLAADTNGVAEPSPMASVAEDEEPEYVSERKPSGAGQAAAGAPASIEDDLSEFDMSTSTSFILSNAM